MTPDAFFCPKTSPLPSAVLSGKALGATRAFQKMVLDPPGGLRDPEPAGLQRRRPEPPDRAPPKPQEDEVLQGHLACLPHTYGVGMFLTCSLHVAACPSTHCVCVVLWP